MTEATQQQIIGRAVGLLWRKMGRLGWFGAKK